MPLLVAGFLVLINVFTRLHRIWFHWPVAVLLFIVILANSIANVGTASVLPHGWPLVSQRLLVYVAALLVPYLGLLFAFVLGGWAMTRGVVIEPPAALTNLINAMFEGIKRRATATAGQHP